MLSFGAGGYLLSDMFYNKAIELLGLEARVTTCISLEELFAGSSNPYVLDGRLRVPSVVERSMATPERVSTVLSDMMRLRGTSIACVAEKSGVPLSRVRALVSRGQGSVSNLLSVCRMLGVKPVKVPHPACLAKGY